MRLGSGLLSFVLHLGFALAGVIAAPYLVNNEPSKMMIIPLDLETADTTNLTPISESAREEEIDAPQPKVESFASSAPPPPAADEILPDETKPEAKKDEPKKAEAAPTPPKQQKTALQEMNEALAGVPRDVSNLRANPGPKPSFDNVNDPGAPRDGTGDRKRNSASIADQIMSQLLARNCWTDQDDMADARRLSAVIAVQFGRDGHIKGQMKLIEPNPRPTSDQVFQVYIQRAYDALSKCNNLGFQVPEAYFQYNPPLIIELRFKP
jgi:outer membrane biosynthesis protein TonB